MPKLRSRTNLGERKRSAGRSTMSLRLAKRTVIGLAIWALFQPIPCAVAGWWTDKWDVRSEIEADGWKTTYFEEIHSETAIQATVAGYFGGQAGFSAWFSNWLNTALRNFSQSLADNYGAEARQAAEDFLWNIIDDILHGQLPEDSYENFSTFQIKTGVAEYHGCNTLIADDCIHPPLPSLQAYVAIRPIEWKGLRICNKSTHEKIFIAISHYDDGAWTTEGWWSIPRGECKKPLSELKNRYVYYHAHSGDIYWTGTSEINTCIHPVGPFEFHQDGSQCLYETRPFVKLDTGDSKSFTIGLK